MHLITVDDSGGQNKNHYKIFFSGSQKPEKSTKYGSTADDADSIYPHGDGWVVQGSLNGGRDGWLYSGAHTRHVFRYPDRIRFKINNRRFADADQFDVTQRDDWPTGSGGSAKPDEPDNAESPPTVADSRGPHAGVRDEDFDGWETVEVRENLERAIRKHGDETLYQVWEDVTVSDDIRTYADNIAIVGKGAKQSTIHARGGFDRLFQFGSSRNASSGIYLRNLDVDVRRATFDKCVIGANVRNRGGYAKDVHVRGEIRGPGDWITCQTVGDSVFEVEHSSALAGADRTERVESYHDSVGIIMVGPSDGTLRLHDNAIGAFPNNGVYCSGQRKHNHNGRLVATDHTGFGSDRDQLRAGNDSVIINPELYTTELKPGHDNTRGIWFRYSRGARVVGGSIKTHHRDSAPAILVDETAGRTRVEGVDIECRSSHHAARGVTAYTAGSQAGPDRAVIVTGCRFHGDGKPRDAVLIKGNRPGSKVSGNTYSRQLRRNVGQRVDNRN